MNFLPLIEGKREGKTLSREQIRNIVAACTAQQIPDYQMAAFLMAVYFQGLSPEETTALTLAMRDSGDMLRFPADTRPLVDKHSTGGVGDKVSLPLAPLLACLGFRVPMISGRGLGITGGTLDKLDSIPGFQTHLPAERIVQIIQETGCVICGQTDRMVPADRILYSLRDVTGTVPSIPLIVSSILSKKLAENLNALILDVKFGAAAFMPTLARARDLARQMVVLGNSCGVNTRALLTGMDTPLGAAAGNWLEIRETVRFLDDPAASGSQSNDLRELVLSCAAHLLVQTGRAAGFETARTLAATTLASGAPRRKWDEMLLAQGAQLEAFRSKLTQDHTAPAVIEIKANKDGYVSNCDARLIGETIRDLGGGRLTKESIIDYDVGVDQLAQPGDRVSSHSILARVHARSDASAQTAAARMFRAFEIAPEPPASKTRVCETVMDSSGL